MIRSALLSTNRRRLEALLAQPAVRQLVRYALAGLLVTQFAAAIYSMLVLQSLNPYAANVSSTACGLIVGYVIHSRWSFRGGRKDSEALQLSRFLLAAAVAFAINNMWIWLLVSRMNLPAITPVPLMMVVTPCLSFLLNRYWVFRAH